MSANSGVPLDKTMPFDVRSLRVAALKPPSHLNFIVDNGNGVERLPRFTFAFVLFFFIFLCASVFSEYNNISFISFVTYTQSHTQPRTAHTYPYKMI